MFKSFLTVFTIILIVVAIFAVSFMISAGIIAAICWAFSLRFTWKAALGLWLIMILLSGSVKSVNYRN